MKKILIILFFILPLLLLSCKKEEKQVTTIGQVNIIQPLTNTNPVLKLHIYTENINIEFMPNILTEKYILKPTKTNTFELIITFKNQEIKVTKILLKENNIETSYPIGNFQTINIKSDTNLITSNTTIINKNNLNITIHNSLEEPIYLKQIIPYKKNQLYGINIGKVDPYKTCVLVDNIKTYNHITITNDYQYEQISGILIFNYLTSLKEYTIYVTYHIDFNQQYMVRI